MREHVATSAADILGETALRQPRGRARRLMAGAVFATALGGASWPGVAAAKDSLVIGVAQFPASLHPDISAQTVQFYAIGFALRPVTALDSQGRNECLLCTELPTLENGLAKLEPRPDGSRGMAVTIKLRPELQWGDGAPVTASDLAFTWKVGSDPNSGFDNQHPWARATGVDVVDAHTAVIHLPKTLTSYNQWDQLLPEHIEGPIYRAGKSPGDYINHTAYNAAPTTPGLWNGPYLISGYQSGAQIQYAPNPHWHGTKPGFEHVVLKLVDNTAALQANLLSGDVDMTPAGIGLSIDQAVALKAQHPGQFVFDFKPGLAYERIDLQTANPFLQDHRVRQALLQAMDRETLVKRLFGGYALVADTWLNDVEPNYTADVPKYAFDPAAARMLLDAAGWTAGSDGIRRNAHGDRLSFEFATTAGNRIRELTQTVMQNWWKAIGVEVSIANQPPRGFFGELMRKRAYTGLAEYNDNVQIGLVPTLTYGTVAIPTPANNYSGQNWAGFSDPRMDSDMAQAETELDPAKQKTLWADMQRVYATDIPELPLYFRTDPDILPPWLRGYVATGREDYVSFWAENWHS
ncbi:MAG: peptide ABC transporter substrate-binding protein [Janthinobacterium lividum]